MLLRADYVLPITVDPIFKGAVVVQDGVIKDVGVASDIVRHYPKEEVRDLGSAVLMPGLVDLHTHLENACLRGVLYDVPYATWSTMKYYEAVKLTEQDWQDSALVGGIQALANGVTTVADVSSNGSALKSALKLGLRSVIYREVGAMDKTRIEHAMNAVDAEISAWRDEAAGSLVSIGIAPAHLFDCHPEVMRRVSAYATRENIPVAMHLAGSREEEAFVKHGSSLFSVNRAKRGFVEVPPWLPTGVSPVKYAQNWDAFESPNVMVIHGVHVDDDDIKIMKKHDVSVAACPRSNAQLGMGLPPLNEYLRAGIRIGFGTDSPAATDSSDLLTETRLGMLLTRATSTEFLSSDKALEMATLGAARALRMDDEIGSLDVGKRADIIAVDLSKTRQAPTDFPASAVVHGCHGSDVIMTMVDGKILYADGVIASHTSMEDAYAMIDKIRAKLHEAESREKK